MQLICGFGAPKTIGREQIKHIAFQHTDLALCARGLERLGIKVNAAFEKHQMYGFGINCVLPSVP